MQSRKITITENGKTKKVSVLEAMLQRQISKALNGDNASFRIITTMIAAAEVNPDSSQALEPSEERLLKDMMEDFLEGKG